MSNEIKATADRRANGWRAVLEFPNGGRQCMASRYGTMEAAIREAKRCLRGRLRYPESCVRDPNPFECQELEDKTWRDATLDDVRRDWWCCSADYPQHESTCINFQRGQEKSK